MASAMTRFDLDADERHELTELRLGDLERGLAKTARALARLRRQLAGVTRPATATDHAAADAQLLGVLAHALGGAVFSVHDIEALGRHHPELAAQVHGQTRLELGARLKRLHGRRTGDYVLHRVGRNNRGVLWCVAAGRPSPRS